MWIREEENDFGRGRERRRMKDVSKREACVRRKYPQKRKI